MPRGSGACVWTCVWNIWIDVKLLTCTLLVFVWVSNLSLVFQPDFRQGFPIWISAGGQWISFHPLPNEDGGLRLWYRDWSSRCTCKFPISVLSSMATGYKPRTGMPFFQQFSNQTTVLFSQSDWAASEQVYPSSKDVESLLRTSSHVGSSNRSWQFCTYDAFHISNSIRYFWASVCVCL